MLLVKCPNRKMLLDVIGRVLRGSLSRSEVLSWHQAVINQFGKDLNLSVEDGYWYFRSLAFLGLACIGDGGKALFIRDSDLEEYIMDIRGVPATDNLGEILRQRPHQVHSHKVMWPLTTYHFNEQLRLDYPVFRSVRGTFEERGDMVEHLHLKFRGALFLLVRQFDELSNKAMILGSDRHGTHLKEFMNLLDLEVW